MPRLQIIRRKVADLKAAVRREVDADVVLLAAALALIAIGLSLVWLPGAYLGPGLVLLWIALPSRRPFIVPDQPTEATIARFVKRAQARQKAP